MAKKVTRKIPSMVLTIVGDGAPDVESLCNNYMFASAVFNETVEGIKDALTNNKKTAILFTLNKSEYHLEIDKTQWKTALQSCLDRLIENEKYELCVEIKQFI